MVFILIPLGDVKHSINLFYSFKKYILLSFECSIFFPKSWKLALAPYNKPACFPPSIQVRTCFHPVFFWPRKTEKFTLMKAEGLTKLLSALSHRSMAGSWSLAARNAGNGWSVVLLLQVGLCNFEIRKHIQWGRRELLLTSCWDWLNLCWPCTLTIITLIAFSFVHFICISELSWICPGPSFL